MKNKTAKKGEINGPGVGRRDWRLTGSELVQREDQKKMARDQAKGVKERQRLVGRKQGGGRRTQTSQLR